MGLGSTGYNIVLVVHIFAVIAWMAGMFYLPRLFVYHADAERGSDKSETFKVMERRLYRGIMTPAIVATWLAGGALVYFGDWEQAGWVWAKVALVLAMSGLHGWLGSRIRTFAADANTTPSRTYRMVNEIPTLILLGILVLVVLKPF